MTIQMGDYNTLEVLRETTYAFVLGDEETEVFLHKNETTEPLEPKQMVTVFLYYDNQKRVTATMNQPIIDQTKAGFVNVVDASYKLGAFLDIGLKKDLLLSLDDLPFVKVEWPIAGDRIFARLKVNKNQLTAKPISRYQISEYITPKTILNVGDEVTAFNIFRSEEGNVFVTEEGHIIFVYFKHMRKRYRIGESEQVTITIHKDKQEYNGTINKPKEQMLDEDAKRIVEYMEAHDNQMPYTDKTNPDIIQMVFKMSKSAFKRAVGTLYKQQLVTLEEERTRLVKSLNNPEK